MSIKNSVFKIIRKNLSIIYEDVAITDGSLLIEDLGFDSVSIITLLIEIEEMFNIDLGLNLSYSDLSTVGKLFLTVTSLIEEQGATNYG